ncbi:MAG: nucleotidyltransferase family protein [Rhodospirillales bacterium]
MTATARERYLDEIRTIVLRHLRGRAAAVYLFGSHAAGTAGRFSDVDVAVDAEAPIPESVWAALAEALDDSTVPWRVDLVDLGRVDPEFRRRVLREGVRWTA